MTGSARRRLKWWGIVFLPILLRSLVPVGFMPMVGADHSIRLVVCDGYAPIPWATETPMSMQMPVDAPMDGAMGSSNAHGGHSGHLDRGSCPYGSSPALGALSSPEPASLWTERAVEPAVASAQVAHFNVLLRAQSSRGPPA